MDGVTLYRSTDRYSTNVIRREKTAVCLWCMKRQVSGSVSFCRFPPVFDPLPEQCLCIRLVVGQSDCSRTAHKRAERPKAARAADSLPPLANQKPINTSRKSHHHRSLASPALLNRETPCARAGKHVSPARSPDSHELGDASKESLLGVMICLDVGWDESARRGGLAGLRRRSRTHEQQWRSFSNEEGRKAS